MIDAARVSVRHGRVLAVDGASLYARDAATVGLIGPNGSGKSTLLRAILGALRREGGTVSVGGADLETLGVRARAELMAVVAQEEPSGLPLTAWDSVLLGRSPRRGGWGGYRPEDEEAAEHAMRRSGVLHLAGRGIEELSGGERQRVLIARALAQGASHLLLDEPTNHLDVRYQHEILGLVAELGLCTILVLHDLNLAARYCEELVLLSAGAVVARGTPDAVLTPEILEPVYGIGVRRIDVDGAPQLFFALGGGAGTR